MLDSLAVGGVSGGGGLCALAFAVTVRSMPGMADGGGI